MISGYTLLCFALIFKTSKHYNYYLNSEKKESPPRNSFIRSYGSILSISSLLILQVSILSAWLSSGGINLQDNIINDRRFIISYTCEYSQQLPAYLSIEVITIVLICFGIIYFLVRTWVEEVIKSVPELKWIMLTTNNLILAFIFILPLTVTIQNDDDVCSIYSTIVLITTVGTVSALVLPQISCKKNNIASTEQQEQSYTLLH